MNKKTIAVSFVHGYQNLEYRVSQEALPALWVHHEGSSRVYNYPVPRNPAEFHSVRHLISGEMPLSGVKDFKSLPRFGLTGLAENGEYLYAGSWNAVYEIRKEDFGINRIISHRLMNDVHGVHVDSECLITVLTGKDAVILTGHDGVVIDHFCVDNDLRVYKDETLDSIDWRFLSKQFRGSTGKWHFNYVQRFGDEIWLTSRNIAGFVVVNRRSRTACLRMMNHMTPVLVHDGLFYKGQYYFTSIDGKIIITESAETAEFSSREGSEAVELFNRDLVCMLMRIEETDFGREPNWCRGIECVDDVMYVTVDGRYDTDLSFGLLGLKRSGEKVLERRLHWKDIGSEKDLRYVTGFDVIAF